MYYYYLSKRGLSIQLGITVFYILVIVMCTRLHQKYWIIDIRIHCNCSDSNMHMHTLCIFEYASHYGNAPYSCRSTYSNIQYLRKRSVWRVSLIVHMHKTVGMLFPNIALVLVLSSNTNCIKKGSILLWLLCIQFCTCSVSKPHYAYSNKMNILSTYIHVDIYSNRVTNSPVLLKN